MFKLGLAALLHKGQNDDRGLSPGVWGDCDLLKHGDDMNLWRWFADDFREAGAPLATNHSLWGPWDAFGTTGLLFTGLASDLNSVLRATLDADTEEAYVSFGTYGNPFARFTKGSDGDCFFEARVRYSNVADTTGVAKMVGLVEHGVPVTNMIASGGASISTRKFVGYRALIADGDGMDAAYHNGTAETVAKEAADNTRLNVATSTFKKFGLRWRSRDDEIDFYVDGVKVAEASTAAAAFPRTALMAPFWGVRQVGAGTYTPDIDWIAGAQRITP